MIVAQRPHIVNHIILLFSKSCDFIQKTKIIPEYIDKNPGVL